jgi:hypothetical protein
MVYLIENADEIAKGCESRKGNILPDSPVRKQVRARRDLASPDSGAGQSLIGSE